MMPGSDGVMSPSQSQEPNRSTPGTLSAAIRAPMSVCHGTALRHCEPRRLRGDACHLTVTDCQRARGGHPGVHRPGLYAELAAHWVLDHRVTPGRAGIPGSRAKTDIPEAFTAGPARRKTP